MATSPVPTAAADILEIIRADHRQIDALFARYAEAGDGSEKLAIVHEIHRILLPHAQAEEELFYPAIADAGSDDDAVEEAFSEHAAAKKTLQSILSSPPDDLTYDMKVKMLQKEIQHHVRDEEAELFEQARDAGIDLHALGAQFEKRKAELKPLIEQQMASASAG